MAVFEIEVGSKVFEVEADDEKSAAELAEQELKADDLADQMEKVTGETGASDLFKNQAMFGMSDKVTGLVGGIKGMFGEAGFGEGFETHRRAQEILEERAKKRSGNLGTAAEIAGAVTTGAAAKAPQALGALGRIGQTMFEGGTLSALHSAGESDARDVGEFAGDVATGAAIGTAASGVLGAGLEVGRAGINALRSGTRAAGAAMDDPAGKAGRKVASALADDGVSSEQALARMRTRDTALINVGDDNTAGLGRAASAQPGAGRKVINRALDQQQKTSFDKVTRAVNESLGGADETFNRRVAAKVTERGRIAKKRYGDAFKQNFGSKHSMHFDVLAKRVPGEAVRNAQKIAQAEGRVFGQQLVASIDEAGNVTFSRTPSLQEWHYIQRGLRSAKDSAYRAGVGEVGEAYKSLHKDILAAMDDASPAYKIARGHYATESQQISALKYGREILNPKSTRNVDMITDELAAMSRPEREMAKLGLARQMEDLIQNTPDATGDVVKKIFGTPAKRNAIRAAFENATEFRKFEVAMGRLAKEGRVFRGIRTGSRTSFVDSEKQAAGALNELANGMTDVATSGVSATVRAGAKLLSKMGQMDEQTAVEVAKILVEKDPNLVMKALSPSAGRAAGQSVRDEFFRRAGELIRGGGLGLTAHGSGALAPELADAF